MFTGGETSLTPTTRWSGFTGGETSLTPTTRWSGYQKGDPNHQVVTLSGFLKEEV
jgi:hypothetical protein